MQRLLMGSICVMNLIGCKANVADDDDDFGTWSSGGAQELPGGATDLPDDENSDDEDDEPDGNLGGIDDGSGSGGGSGGDGGSGSDGGSGESGGSGSGSTNAYAGGYPINPCASIPTATGMSVGDVSPDWTLQDQYGETVRLSDFCGSVVLLESVAFW